MLAVSTENMTQGVANAQAYIKDENGNSGRLLQITTGNSNSGLEILAMVEYVMNDFTTVVEDVHLFYDGDTWNESENIIIFIGLIWFAGGHLLEP